MLQRLHIKNVALIEEAEIVFGPGLNILTGETGAGKSMIIDAVSFVLGERSGKDLVRRGQAKAEVEAEFVAKAEAVKEVLRELELEEEEQLILFRTMTAEGKSTCRINGTVVTASAMKRLSETLIDIHGQHAHQSLLNPARHMDLLDHFCGSALVEEKEKLKDAMIAYKSVVRQLEELGGDPKKRAERVAMLKEVVAEIGQAKVEVGEEETLLSRRDYCLHVEEIAHCAAESLAYLYLGKEGEGGALELVSRARAHMDDLYRMDERTKALWEQMAEVSDGLQELCRQLSHYSESIQRKPEALQEIEERLDVLYGLKRKYGGSLERVLQTQAEAEEELKELAEGAAKRKVLEGQKKALLEEIGTYCSQLTHLRTQTAQVLTSRIEAQLHQLEMQHAVFQVSITQKNTFNARGRDVVEFLISPNLGEEVKPLAKIASGGEMSRVMLALKTVLADADTIDTFIFDEIDTGVSGTTAARVGEKMSDIGRSNQVLCITHLPQIAAMADRHFLIAKRAEETKTVTSVTALEETGQVEELSRLMGGGKAGEAVTAAAQELKAWAKAYKQEQETAAATN